MKIVVYPHDLGLGGSQLNAIELGAAVQSLGHEVILFGQPGPLTRRALELGLEYVEAPIPGKRPSPAVIRALVRLVRERGVDIIHGYEWPPALECLVASKVARGSDAVATVMSMAVAPFIPHSMPLMVGTEQIRRCEEKAGRTMVHLMEPPVDTAANSPDAGSDALGFREQWGLAPGAMDIVCVSRLSHELKLEGILAALDAVKSLTSEKAVRLVIVGSGPAEAIIRERARRTNAEAGRTVVVLTGELEDPRPAYAAADVVLGMGGSALRGMSFAKPLVVQGERGFWELLTPESLPTFLWQGWYGSGSGKAGGSSALATILARLLHDQALREALGAFGRRLVVDRFSLAVSAQRQLDLYKKVAASRKRQVPLAPAEAFALARYSAYVARRRWLRIRGKAALDDFNARPVASLPAPVPAEVRP
ncbi:glycosyltransferase family 4 protein [Paenarthrobacter sp. NPDC058040]|uniref:glycosyltransferase family 4 protein n=1 Tax=unclassified Paenarthrobacter TaxID=2634190 RepID=UPI0036DEC9AC